MYNRRDVKVGDIVPVGANVNIKKYNKCSSIYYGVVVGFTINHNPRAFILYFTQKVSKRVLVKDIKRSSVIIPQAISINKEDLFNHGGKYKYNYELILNTIKNEESKDIQSGEKKRTNISIFLQNRR